MDEERKYGVCPICKEKTNLYFAIGIYKGNIWSNWICNKCFDKLRNNNSEKENETVRS